jgi:tetratricopeptide (TPR) repeat protein
MTKPLIAALLLAMPAVAFAQRDSVRAREAYLEGRTAMREKKTSAAIDAFDRATKLDPRSEYFVWLGHAHTRDISTASFIRQPIVARRIRSAYDKAVELDSTNVEAAEARVEYYTNAPGIAGGGKDKARAEAARLKKLHSERGDIALGFIEEREGRLEAAEGIYKAAIQAAPDSATRVIGELRLTNLQRKMRANK